MKNLHTLLIGTTGSGKTTFARRLLSLSPRAVVLDSEFEYEDGAIFYSFREAAEYLKQTGESDFHLIFRGDDQRELFGMMDLAFHMQRLEGTPPLAVFLEEAGIYSSPHELDPILENLLVRGRRQCLSVVSVSQWETQQHPIIRANSRLWVAFNQTTFSSDMRRRFQTADLDRMLALEPLTPGTTPEYGRHYVTSPPNVEVERAWIEAVTFNRPEAPRESRDPEPRQPQI